MTVRMSLTTQQQWLWDLTQRFEDWQCVAAYAFRWRGPLSIPLLERSFAAVIQRHSALRTRITADSGCPHQEIADPHPYHLDIQSISEPSAAERETCARRHVERLCDSRLSTNGVLWSAKLLALSDHEHWLCLAMHRLIGDCASIDQTYREIRAHYEALLSGQPAAVAEAAQYSDYAMAQARAGEEWQRRHEPYWNKALQEMRPLQWLTDPDCIPPENGIIGKMSCDFGAELSAALQDLGRRARTLTATLMLTVYAAVLWRWCGQNDFVLPFNIAGRQSTHKSTIGYFSYLLHLQVRISAQETFRELLHRLNNGFFGALAHQDYGRVAIKHPELVAGTVFQWLTWHPDDQPEEGVATTDSRKPAVERVSVRDFGEGLTIVPPGMTAVELTFFDTTKGLCAYGTYRADRFAAGTMERFMAELRSATALFIANPDTRLDVITGISRSEGYRPNNSQIARRLCGSPASQLR